MLSLSRFGVSLDRRLLRAFDQWLAKKGFANRSQALAELIRGRLVQQEWESAHGEVVGIVTLLYDPEHHVLSHSLMRTQHAHHDVMVSSQHVHLDAHNCLEVDVLKGPAKDVRALADRLQALKGIRHGQFVMSTSGRALA